MTPPDTDRDCSRLKISSDLASRDIELRRLGRSPALVVIVTHCLFDFADRQINEASVAQQLGLLIVKIVRRGLGQRDLVAMLEWRDAVQQRIFSRRSGRKHLQSFPR